jgi:hypothetical protein
VNRKHRTRTRQKQINILHTTTKKRHSQKQVTQVVVWGTLVLAMIAVLGVGLNFGINLLLKQVLYTNPRYNLSEIDIEPKGVLPNTPFGRPPIWKRGRIYGR